MFNTGNEGFKRFSVAWETGVRDIARHELAERGFGARLVGSNTHDPQIEAAFDYATRHKSVAQNSEAWPVMVTEYSTQSPEHILENVRQARGMGTAFHYWMGGQTIAERQKTLEGLKEIVEGG
jgi:hypothetical protein